MIIFKSINTLVKEVNFKANIGFVPTMGSLHKGHVSLINTCKKKCKKTIVTIFVNPSQFNNKNDYKNYPRNIHNDLLILKRLKVDYVLIPSIKNMFKTKKEMKIPILNKYKVLCAKFRPGHFEGVLGIINKFLKKIRSKYIFLGEKDFQQAYLIKNFIKRKFKTKVYICETVRSKYELPFSSRNVRLYKEDLLKASKVSQAIKKLFFLIKKNFKNKDKITEIKKFIKSNNINLQYLEIRNKNNLSSNFNQNNFKIFVAFFIKKIRLIDNV